MTKSNLDIVIPNVKAFAYETHEDLPQSHQQVLCIGKRGSGKTIAVVNLINKLNYDRIFWVSPTCKSNQTIMSMLKIDDNDIYEDIDDITIPDQIKAEIEEEARMYDEYHERMRKYKLFIKQKEHKNVIDDELLIEFFNPNTDQFEKPTHWLNGRRAHMVICYDDCLGSVLFSKGARKMTNMAILHRHLGSVTEGGGGALGASIFYLSQSFKTQTGGIPRAVRNNSTSLIVFKTKSDKELIEIQEEVGGEVEKNDFYKIYNYATAEPHSFLFIDLHPKTNHPSKYRKCFNEFICVNENSNLQNEKNYSTESKN
jgi:hypothetical protein